MNVIYLIAAVGLAALVGTATPGTSFAAVSHERPLIHKPAPVPADPVVAPMEDKATQEAILLLLLWPRGAGGQVASLDGIKQPQPLRISSEAYYMQAKSKWSWLIWLL